jgi:sec-independent protein translocase protein TatA
MGFFGSPGMSEMLIIGMIALLLFGKRLPEVARSVGKSLHEFRSAISGFQNEISSPSPPRSNRAPARPDRAEAEESPSVEADDFDLAVPKFAPPTPSAVGQGSAVEEPAGERH